MIRKDLSAIVGRHNRRSSDSAMVAPAVDSGERLFGTLCTLRLMRGSWPSNTSMGISTGVVASSGSVTRRRPSPVISPTTAKGQRSRSHKAANRSTLPGTSAST